LKDKIKRRKDELADTSRTTFPSHPISSHPLPFPPHPPRFFITTSRNPFPEFLRGSSSLCKGKREN
jgi:hypothetical protein